MMMQTGYTTSKEITEFFANFGMDVNKEYEAITFKQVVLIVKVARKWHNDEFMKFIADCFRPIKYNKEGMPTSFIPDLPNKEELDMLDRQVKSAISGKGR